VEVGESDPDAEEEGGGAEDDVGRLSFGRDRGRCQGVSGRADAGAIDRLGGLVHGAVGGKVSKS
jgi:hypothetical protein